MNRIWLVIVGIVSVLMLKQTFLLSSGVSQENIWILVGIGMLVVLAIQNFYLKNRSVVRTNVIKADIPKMSVGTDLKLELILRKELKQGSKIEAIKILREETGMGLKEAKIFIDQLEAS